MQSKTIWIFQDALLVGLVALIGLPAALARPPHTAPRPNAELTAATGSFRHSNQGYVAQPTHSNQGGNNGDGGDGGDGGEGPGFRITDNPDTGDDSPLDTSGGMAGVDGDLWTLDLNLDSTLAEPSLVSTTVGPDGFGFGPTSGSGPNATIPEPSTMLLITFGGLLLRRRRRA